MMGQPEESFFKSSVGKVVKMISLHNKYNLGNTEGNPSQIPVIKSMKEIAGW